MTLIWTSIPAGVRRSSASDPWVARVSLVLTARLEAPGGELTLAEFQEFLDWPRTLRESAAEGVEFEFSLRSGDEVIATSTVKARTDPVDAPDSLAWQRLFGKTTRVRNFADQAGSDNQGPRGAPTGAGIDFYDAGGVVREIRNFYGEALRHDLGMTEELPPLSQFAVSSSALRGAPSDNGSAIERFARFYHVDERPRRAAGDNEIEETEVPDFHQIVSALGSHPHLMRKLGLVLDFEIALDNLPLDRANVDPAIRIEPLNADFTSTLHYALWTAIDYRVGSSAVFRLFSVAEPNRDNPAGLLALADDTTIAQEKLEHAALTLMQQAQAGSDEAEGVPALLQGGMRVTHSGIAGMIDRAMAAQASLEASLQKRKAGQDSGRLGGSDDMETLYADQLTLGVRADVRHGDTGSWRSLCRRLIRYRAGDWSWPAEAGALEDEGVIEPTAYKDRFADSTRLRATTDLFEWDGWSLAVQRPDDKDAEATLLPADVLPDGAAPLTATIHVPPGSLEPQRFGRCYTFRTRTVYLAGVGISAEEADEIQPDLDEASLTTRPTCCLRVESAKPPVTVRAQDRGFGEAGDIVVLRDADDERYRTHEYKLHVLPPAVPLRIAEKHGVFDSLSPVDSWQMIERHRGKLARDGDTPDDDISAEQREITSETVTARELFTPYLPDPMVKQAILSLPDDAGKVDLPRFDDLPRHLRGKELARSCRLIFRAGRDGINARVSGRDVFVELLRGRMHTLEVAAKLSSDELSIFAVAHADWLGGNRLAEAMGRLATAAATGDAPIVAPARKIRVVYATQRPLVTPAFGRALILPRDPVDTSAMLADDALQFDRPSTGRIDVYARWEDPVDDASVEGWATVANEMHAGGVDIDLIDGKPLDPIELEQVSRSPLSHDFGDTRHHEVLYSAVATSRFADFYPADVTADPQNITRTSDSITLHVPSTAPPAAPDVAYVLPTFRKDRTEPVLGIDGEYSIQHRGEGLRVYLNRGWFSSGIGEQLALVVATPNTPVDLREQVSEWGINPLRDAAPLPGPLEMAQVWGGTKRIEHWQLEEGSVGLVIYDVQWSEQHKLPFADIEFMSQRAFMPLVRLALARYQQHAIEYCELSRIVHADFVPLTPGRAVTVSKLNRRSWKLEMRGYSYADPGTGFDIAAPNVRTSVVEAQIEVMPRNTPEDVAAWRPLGPGVELNADAVEPWRFHWTGRVKIVDFEYLSRLWRRRLVIREYEVFPNGGIDDMPIADRSRLISAHSVNI